jgi:hypothetical protein
VGSTCRTLSNCRKLGRASWARPSVFEHSKVSAGSVYTSLERIVRDSRCERVGTCIVKIVSTFCNTVDLITRSSATCTYRQGHRDHKRATVHTKPILCCRTNVACRGANGHRVIDQPNALRAVVRSSWLQSIVTSSQRRCDDDRPPRCMHSWGAR